MKFKKLLLAGLVLVGFYSCDDTPQGNPIITINSITFNPTAISLKVGEIKSATIDVLPSTLSFSVSDLTITHSVPDIVSLTITNYKEGVFTFTLEGKKAGSTNLTLSLKNSDKKASAVVNVSIIIIPLEYINLSIKSLTLNTGDNYQLSTNVTPKNATDTTIFWSTDSDIATVTNNGYVTAVRAGTVYITAASIFDRSKTEVCTLTIKEPVKSIEVSATSVSVKLGTKVTLTAKALPNNATDKLLNITLENNEFANLDINGNIITITPIKAGVTNILISSSNPNVSLKVPLSVIFEGITSLNIVEETKTLDKDESYTLNTEILPADASNKTLTWSSEKPEIVSVLNGVITGHKSGSSKIYAVSNADNTKKDSCIVSVTGIMLNKYTLKLDKGAHETLMATKFPADFNTNTITFSSSNPDVASVDASTGEITGVAVGDADITATLQNTDALKPPYTAICKVSVSIFLKSIVFTNPRLVLERYGSETLVPEFTPNDAGDKTLKWISSNDNVAYVDENGVVNAIAIGEADVKAISNFDTTIKATAKVFVKGIILDNNVLNLKVGNIETIIAKQYPTDLSDMTLKWESSHPDIASVDQSGNIKALKEGTAIITVKSVSDNTITATCTVNVAASPYGINISHSSLILNKRQNATLTAEIVKTSVTNKQVSWMSDNEAVASVDASGVVTTHLAGSANIIAYSEEDGTVRDTCRLSVNGINLDHKTLSIPKGKTGKITPIVLITKTTDLSVTYTSENAKASVDANGLITAKDTGMVHIIVISVHNSKLKDTVLVTVQGLQFNVSSLELRKGGSQTVTVTAYPSSLTGGITWSSEDESKATVNSGTINGIAYGETNIIATYSDIPEITEKLKVSIIGIELDHTTLSIIKGKTAVLKNLGFSAKTTNLAATYTSSDPAIASVDNNGLVTAKAQGEVTITVTFVNDNSLTATCKVIVQTLTFDITKLTLRKTETKQINATIYPSSLTGGVTWTTGSDQIASVSTTGLVTANNHGTTKITATSNDNPDLKLDLEVNVIGFTLNNKSISLFRNEKNTLTTTFTPSDFSDQSVTWTSKDISIATVENGVVTGIDLGVTKIYAYSNYDNTLKDSCEVSIKGIKFDTKKITFDGLYYLNYTVKFTKYPSDLDVGTLTWKSDNPSKVTVNNNGYIEHVSSGGFIRVSAVSSVDDRITDTIDVQEVGISFDKTNSIYLLKGNSTNIKATYYYYNGTITEKTTASFESDDPTIASVNSAGLITANEYGSTNIKLSDYFYIPVFNGQVTSAYSYIEKNRIYIPNISINSILLINNREVKSFKPNLIPTDLPDKTIIYENDNPNIAIINPDGTIIKKGVGTANITAKYRFNTSDEVTATTTITLYNFYLNKNELALVKNNSETLIATVDLGNLSNDYKWSSSNENFATVSQNGLVQALNYGQATIYITSDVNPTYKDSCIVKITRTAYMSSFKFEMSKNPGMQNDVVLTNYNDVQYGGDFKYIANNKLIPTFTLSPGATVKVNNVLQTSGASEIDFTSPVNYVVTSSDALESETFRVALNFVNDSFIVSNSGELISNFRLKSNIKTAILADSINGFNVISIGNSAFFAAKKLETLYITNKITKIGTQAFTGTNLIGDLYIPPNVESIGNYAFNYISTLNSIRYREGTTIGTQVFDGTVAPTTYTWP